MRRGLLGIGLAAVLSACSPPGMLNGLDSVTGSGSGVEQAGVGIAFGDHGQKLDVWRPEGKSARPRPVLIFWYGGGWVKGKRQEYGFAGRAYAARGFVVVVADSARCRPCASRPFCRTARRQ
jgi:acetyl esterase/lipase